MNKKILIIVGGPKGKLDPFSQASENLGLDVTLASFSELEFFSKEIDGKFILKVQGKDVSWYDLIYIRMVGKRLEEATLLANYVSKGRVRIIDSLYEKSLLMPLSLSKAMEMKCLIEAGIPIPKTLFGNLKAIAQKGEALLSFPFVIKSTSGRKARDVWLAGSEAELTTLLGKLREREKKGEHFFAQEFIRASQRTRVFIIGNEVIGAITRPTKWRRLFLKKINGEYPEGKKGVVFPLPSKSRQLALRAARAASLEIAGVDILEEDVAGKPLVIEINAAPSWKAIKKDTGAEVEKKILLYLRSL